MPVHAINPRYAPPAQKPGVGARLDRETPLAIGLVGFWPMLEGAGQLVSDYSGYGSTGTLNSAAVWAPSFSGRAINFGASTAATLDCGRKGPLNLTGSVSLSCWVYSTGPVPGVDNYPRLLGNLQLSNFNGYELVYAASNSGSGVLPNGIYIQIANGGSLAAQSDVGTLPLGRWVHFVGTYNAATGVLNLYRDGLLRGSQNAGANFIGSSADNFCVGNLPASGFNFPGQVDLATVWSREITAAEVMTLYRNPYILLRANPDPSRTYFFVPDPNRLLPRTRLAIPVAPPPFVGRVRHAAPVSAPLPLLKPPRRKRSARPAHAPPIFTGRSLRPTLPPPPYVPPVVRPPTLMRRFARGIGPPPPQWFERRITPKPGGGSTPPIVCPYRSQRPEEGQSQSIRIDEADGYRPVPKAR